MEKMELRRNLKNHDLLIDVKIIKNMDMIKREIMFDFYTIGFMVEADGKVKIEDHEIMLKNNTILLVGPNQKIHIEHGKIDIGIFLFFDEEFLNLFFNDQYFMQRFEFFNNTFNLPYIQIPEEDEILFCKIVKEMEKEINKYEPDSAHVLRALLYFVLIKINRIYAEKFNTFSSFITDNNIVEFKSLIDKKARQEHNVQYYADSIGISRAYLNKITKKYLGKTPKEIIKERLRLEAKRELLYTKKSIYDISVDLNFYELSNFIRFFRENTGVTPAQYRKKFTN